MQLPKSVQPPLNLEGKLIQSAPLPAGLARLASATAPATPSTSAAALSETASRMKSPSPFCLGAGFIHVDRAALEIFAVECGDGLLRVLG